MKPVKCPEHILLDTFYQDNKLQSYKLCKSCGSKFVLVMDEVGNYEWEEE